MKKTILLLLLSIWLNKINAQSTSPEILSSSGDSYEGTSMRLDWTLGEVAITSLQNASHQITQGFHQPTYVLTNIDELSTEIGQIKIFPNPTPNWLTIDLNFDQLQDVSIQLIDLNGKIIWRKQNQGQQFSEQLNISSFPQGTYFLKFLLNKNLHTQTFKIQKIN